MVFVGVQFDGHSDMLLIFYRGVGV